MSKKGEATLLLKITATGQDVFNKLKGGFSDIRYWATAAFGVLTAGQAVKAFKESEQATNKLNQALINQGIYTKAIADGYDRMAKELQSVTTFEDDAIKSAQATMQAYLGQTRVSKELMMATLDLATAKKVDLASAADMVAKTIGTGTNALARQGIAIKENSTQSEKLSQVLAQLNARYGGQAEAATSGLGALNQMKNAWGDLLEVIGERMAPYIVRWAKALTEITNQIQNNQTAIRVFDVFLKVIAGTIAFVKMQIANLGDAIVAYFSTIYEVVTKVASGDFAGAFQSIKSGFSTLGKDVKQNFSTFMSEIQALRKMDTDKKKADDDAEKDRIKANAEARKGIRDREEIDWEQYFKARDEKELNRLIAQERLKNDAHLQALNQKIANEKDATEKYRLEKEKRKYLDENYAQQEQQDESAADSFRRFRQTKRMQNFEEMLGNMSELQNSKSKEMVVIGKAAALANIAINTAQGALGAYAAFAIPALGPVGVGLGIGAAGALVAYGGERAASVAGIQLAEGGVIKATPGGVHAIIGEGGRDEAVIPLENGRMLGTTINLVIQGGLLGDQQQAREFATKLDLELFKLRQANQSMAFDRGVI